jgi:hypothetical protein
MVLPSNSVAITGAHPYIGPLLVNALNCLCEAAAARPNPPQHCSFRIGTTPPHDMGLDGDMCCEGLAYVTMTSIFPSSEGFPGPDTNYQASAKCAPLSWGVVLKLALVRCAPVGDQDMIPDREWEEAMLQDVYDSWTLMAAACCTRAYVLSGSARFIGMSAIAGTVVQGDPLGGCVERSIEVTVQIPNCDC